MDASGYEGMMRAAFWTLFILGVVAGLFVAGAIWLASAVF